MLEFINFYLIPGVVLGSIYALGAIGVTLLFGILRFAHFAHGDLMSLGAYVALSFVAVLGFPTILALPFAMIFVAALSVGVDRAFYRPFRKGPTIIVVIASFGVALMIRSAIQLFWGVEITSYVQGIQRPLVLFDSLRIAERHIWIISLTVVFVVLMHLFLTRSKLGKGMRAMSDDADLARITGINTRAVIAWTWIIGGGLAAAGGVFLAMDTQLNPSIGWNAILPIFAAAVLGGIGKPYGAVVGGLIIGLAEELSNYPWFGLDPLLSPGYKSGVAFGIMVLMLIFRPSGLFRGRVL